MPSGEGETTLTCGPRLTVVSTGSTANFLGFLTSSCFGGGGGDIDLTFVPFLTDVSTGSTANFLGFLASSCCGGEGGDVDLPFVLFFTEVSTGSTANLRGVFAGGPVSPGSCVLFADECCLLLVDFVDVSTGTGAKRLFGGGSEGMAVLGGQSNYRFNSSTICVLMGRVQPSTDR